MKIIDLCLVQSVVEGNSINPKNGQVLNDEDFNWFGSSMLDSAKINGCRIELCANLFGRDNITTFLSSNVAQENFIKNVIWLLKMRNADGVNLDFELMPGNLSDEFVVFVAKLRKRLVKELPMATVSLAIPAVD